MEASPNILKNLSDAFGTINKKIGEKRPEEQWIYDLRAKYFESLYTAKDRGQPVAWMSFGASPELFHAMDVIPVSPESLTAIMAGFPEGVVKYLDHAQRFVPDHLCGANKTMIGAALSGEFPRPDVIVHASQPCDSGLISFGALAEYLEVPHFCIDTPYYKDDRSYRYLAKELDRLASFLEEHTGNKLDEDKLREVVENSNEAQSYVLQINDLRKNVPCPLSSRFLMLNAGVSIGMSGTPELVEYYKKQYEVAKAVVDAGKGHLSEEKIRLGWIYTPIFYDLGIFDWMEKEFGAIVTMDMMGHYSAKPIENTSDMESIFMGLARRLTTLPMGHQSHGPMEFFSDWSVELCRDYKTHAAVFAGNFACKHGWAIVKLIKDKINDELGIPTFIFDLDIFDPRMKSSDAAKAELQDFFTTLIN